MRESASTVLDYATSLDKDQYDDFWLPCMIETRHVDLGYILICVDTAHLLVSATTALLRCTVESPSYQEKEESTTKLAEFLKSLRVAHESTEWDLAEMCIEVCGQAIESRINAVSIGTEDSLSRPHLNRPSAMVYENTSFPTIPEDSSLRNFMEDVSLPSNLDIPWGDLWDSTNDTWQLPQ